MKTDIIKNIYGQKICKQWIVYNYLFLIILISPLFICNAVIAKPATLQPVLLTPVKLILQWYPQTQFAGFYIAKNKGFYANYGIDLKIISGGPDANPSQMLADKMADFGTMFLSSAIKSYDSGLKLVNVGQIVQRSALMLIARKGTGINTIKDLHGKRIGMWNEEFQLQPRALFKREGIKVNLIRQSPSFDLFMRGGLDAVPAMWYNEYHTLSSYGLDYNEMVTFFFNDLGFNFPEDGIYCLRSTLNKKSDMVHNFVKATAKGWDYTFAHPEEALNIVLSIMKKKKIRANKSHQRWMLDRMKDIILLDKNTKPDMVLGKTEYEFVVNTLLKLGFISNAPVYYDFYKKIRIQK